MSNIKHISLPSSLWLVRFKWQTSPLLLCFRCWWMLVGPGAVTSSSSPQKWVWMEAQWPDVIWMSLRLPTPLQCPACPRLKSSWRRALPTHWRGKTSSTSEEPVSDTEGFEWQTERRAVGLLGTKTGKRHNTRCSDADFHTKALWHHCQVQSLH